MQITFRSLLLFSAVTILASAAAATPGPGKLRRACKEDARSFCGDVKPGGGRIISCLQDHYKELSDDCYDALKNMPAPKGRGSSKEEPAPSHDNNDGPPQHDDTNEGPPPDSRSKE
jgi:hypothetical protein